jgi:hypothetical protein
MQIYNAAKCSRIQGPHSLTGVIPQPAGFIQNHERRLKKMES